MDEEHKDRIEEDYMYLSVCMRENIKRLVKYLVEKKTIDNEQEEDVLVSTVSCHHLSHCLSHPLPQARP